MRGDPRICGVRSVFLALLFSAFAAAAQPVVGPEIASAPLAGTFEPAPPALINSEGEFVMAWSEAGSDGLSRVHVAKLDTTGHVTGAVRVLSADDASRHAVRPAITATPLGYLVAWVEETIDRRYSGVVVCPLDRTLVPLREPSYFALGTSVLLASSGDRIFVALYSSLYPVDALGRSSATVYNLSPGTTELIVTPTRILTLGQWSAYIPPFFCRTFCNPIPQYNLQVVDVFRATTLNTFGFFSDLGAALAFDGTTLFVVWYDGSAAEGGAVRFVPLVPSFDIRFDKTMVVGTFPPDKGYVAKPRLVSDGVHFLIVWELRNGAGHDLMGALVTGDTVGAPFTIARGASLPSLVPVSPGRFLVAYETNDAAGRHIAGRFIDVTSRRRAF